MIEHIRDTEEEQDKWKWMHSTPNAILSFCDNQDVFLAILEKVKKFNAPLPTKFSASKKFSNENNILHHLSKDPLSDKQMELLMIALQQEDVRPDDKNSDGKTFLDLSPIFQKLLQQIQTSTDEWAIEVFLLFITNPKVFESWIELGDDSLLEAVLDRLSQSLLAIKKHVRNLFKFRNLYSIVTVKYFLQKQNLQKFEPIRCWPIRLIWKKKSKLPRSFEALLFLIAKYHDYVESKLKYLCKKNLSYNRKEDHKGKYNKNHP